MTGILIVATLGLLFGIGAVVYWMQKSSDKLLLGAFISLVSIIAVSIVVVAIYGDVDHPLVNLLSVLFYVFLLFLPPLMYLYVDHYLSEDSLRGLVNRKVSHFYLPIGLLVVNLTSYIAIYSSSEESNYAESIGDILAWTNLIALLFVFLLQNIYFLFQGARRYRRFKQERLHYFSDDVNNSAQSWMVHFLWGYAIFIALIYIRQIFSTGDISFAVVLGAYLAFIGYKGLRNPGFAMTLASASASEEVNTGLEASVDNDKLLESVRPQAAAPSEEPMKMVLPQEVQEQIWARMELIMNEDKAYLDLGLTLYSLAKLAETNSKYLRLTIKHKTGQNFSGYVNNFRVEEAKRRLESGQSEQYTIESIGEMSGFKSKSAFYSAFKEFTGLTPRQFQGEMGKNHST